MNVALLRHALALLLAFVVGWALGATFGLLVGGPVAFVVGWMLGGWADRRE